eukprot:16452354-Heterocapsa_arctica.AAC.1
MFHKFTTVIPSHALRSHERLVWDLAANMFDMIADTSMIFIHEPRMRGYQSLLPSPGEMTEDEEETPAVPAHRGQAALVTASCPRSYPQDPNVRQQSKALIPADFTTAQFLKEFMAVWYSTSNVKLQKVTCHDEPHKRYQPSGECRERHKHIVLLAAGTFAHLRIATAFQKKFGLRLSFSFYQSRFGGYLRYCMVPGKKPSNDLDLCPAKYPLALDLQVELAAAEHPVQGGAGKKRKNLTFDEVSNIIIEGPIHTAIALSEAARALKAQGKPELWNYVGALKTLSDERALVAKVWRMNGTLQHAMWRAKSPYVLAQFNLADLPHVRAWLDGGYKKRTLILAGSGGLGKTQLAMALMHHLCPGGFWFLDDPDDFRTIDGDLQPGHGIVVDEVTLQQTKPNQVKKMFDLENARSIACRYFNASLPGGCPRIFITNDEENEFLPSMNKRDGSGVKRRMLFQEVERDIRSQPGSGSSGSQVTAAVATSGEPSHGLHAPEPLRITLTRLLVAAHLREFEAGVFTWCDSLGVAVMSEVTEHLAALMAELKLLPMQVRRLEAAVLEMAKPQTHLAGQPVLSTNRSGQPTLPTVSEEFGEADEAVGSDYARVPEELDEADEADVFGHTRAGCDQATA